MKKTVSILLAAALTAGCLVSCGPAQSAAAAGTKRGDDDGVSIVTTIFPEYDWVKNVLGDNPAQAEVSMLLDNGVDLHSYQPNVEDIMKIGTCDLFIYVGGESDEWVDDALKEAVNKDMVVINLLEVLGERAREEELVEGMQGEEEEEGEDGEEEEVEYDEHVWLSLKNTEILVNAIAEGLGKADGANAGTYSENANAYIEKLKALDAKYEAAVSSASNKTLLFGDRFPFRYLVDDYGLSYYAAFVGCSAETEASFETVTFLAGKVDELGLGSVITIEGTDHRIAQTIIENTSTKDQQILTMDSMQSVTASDVEKGASYLDIMEKNLTVLESALQGSQAAGPGAVITTADTGDDAGSPDVSEGPVDVDLTTLSSTMVYSEVFNMMSNPENYLGKRVKMAGSFATYHDDNTGKDYYACIIKDATACCAQGIEFTLSGDHPYPREGEEICVEGIFDTYTEGENVYCTLDSAVML